MTSRDYGRLADGRTVAEFSIASGPVSARILNFGAILADLVLRTPEGERSIVLGFDRLEDYVSQDAYLGAIAGRCANRIRDGRFDLDGRSFALARNDGGRNHLHGGTVGFDKRLWTVGESSSTAVELRLHSPDGEEGYPGNVDVNCRYEVDPEGLTISLTATTDAATLLNLATHSYFALDDGPTILDHRLTIPAARWTPVDDTLIPSGEIASVDDTPFDFRKGRRIRDDDASAPTLYDHNLVLADAPREDPALAARLESLRTGIALEVHTTEPGLQFYDGNFLPPKQRLRGGRAMVRHAGLCLEPQRFPDAIHNPAFAGAILRPGERYRQVTRYRLFGGA